jgi:Ni/Co efflux regulator RcnB
MSIGEKTKLLWQDPEYRKRMSNAHKGHVHTEEQKRKISEAAKGNTYRKGKVAWNKGKKSPWLSERNRRLNPLMKDEKAYNWKGNETGKEAKHMWVISRLGRPSKCEHCGLDDPKRIYHWANVDHKYSRDLGDYMRLCVPCHRKYDYARV